jgi:hypothetical protein
MRKHEWDTTNGALVTATVAVFAERRVRVAHAGRLHEVPEGWTKVAMIGFAGETMRGMLALLVAPSLLACTCPIEGHFQDDWHCELANLVLARFKRELLNVGVSVHLSTPMLACGTNVALDTAAVSAVVHRFESDKSEVAYVVLDAIAEPAARLSAPQSVAAVAGDVVIF